MTSKHPDFTDITYAKARARTAARKGIKLSDAGDVKGAKAAYDEALKHSKEAERLEKIVKKSKLRR